MRERIKGLIFDKDGTLFDFYRTWGPVTEDAALLVAGGDREKARYVLEKSGKDMVTGKYVPSSPIASGSNRQIVEVWCALLDIADVDAVYEKVHQMFLQRQKHAAVPVLDLDRFFGRLKGRGLRLGVATMDSEESARAAMRIFKADQHLDFRQPLLARGLSACCLSRQRELSPPLASDVSPRGLGPSVAATRSSGHARLLLYLLGFHFSVYVASPYFTPYMPSTAG